MFTVGVVCDQEPEEFNQFLTKTYNRLKDGNAANFFQLLSSKNISLISKEEAPDRFASFLLCVHCG
jgi:ATP-dependent DNA helicase 2 subunit 2